MKKIRLLLLLSFVSVTFFTASAFKSSIKTDKNSSLDVEFEKTPGKTNKKPAQTQVTLSSNPAKVPGLIKQIKELKKIAQDAKKLKDLKTVRLCQQLSACLEVLLRYHQRKAISRKDMDKLSRYGYIDKDFAQIRKRIASAKRSTPQGKKVFKFQQSAKNYLRKAKQAAAGGNKDKAEYYNICAEIKKELALKYAKNPKIEALYKKRLKTARAKYNQQSANKLAVRYRKRAKDMRGQNNSAKAEYYEKAANLKEKLAKAYVEKNYKLIKSLKKEYQLLQEQSL